MSDRAASTDAFRGRLITFEGGEGAGKSSQVERLGSRLRNLGLEVVVTREPGGSPGAERIRSLLLETRPAFDPLAETLLFLAARREHLVVTILPALARGATVICDRFTDSTMAYQGVGEHVSTATLVALSGLVLGSLAPDATLILDVEPEIGLARAASRRQMTSPDRFESESLAFHHAIRAAFRRIAEQDPRRCVLIAAYGAKDEIAGRVWSAVLDKAQGWSPVA